MKYKKKPKLTIFKTFLPVITPTECKVCDLMVWFERMYYEKEFFDHDWHHGYHYTYTCLSCYELGENND